MLGSTTLIFFIGPSFGAFRGSVRFGAHVLEVHPF